jgi:hypothetical protein
MAESPQFVLPFAEREYVDVTRAGVILGVSGHTVLRLARSGALEMIDYRNLSKKKVLYSSIVAFCDRLRAHYRIPDRRPVISPHFRHRDADLLPFRLSVTMSACEAMRALGFSDRRPLLALMQEGCFEAYRIGNVWRISRPSFVAYLEEVRAHPRTVRAGSRTGPYARPIFAAESGF